MAKLFGTWSLLGRNFFCRVVQINAGVVRHSQSREKGPTAANANCSSVTMLPSIKIGKNVAGASLSRPLSGRPRPDRRCERRDASCIGLARDAPDTFMPEEFHKSLFMRGRHHAEQFRGCFYCRHFKRVTRTTVLVGVEEAANGDADEFG